MMLRSVSPFLHIRLVILTLLISLLVTRDHSLKGEEIRFQTDHLILTMNEKGRTIEIIDRRTGRNHLRANHDQRFCYLQMVKNDNLYHSPVEAIRNNDLLEFRFDNDAKVTLRVQEHPSYLSVQVISVKTAENAPFYKLAFGRGYATLESKGEDRFVLSSLCLSIQTDLGSVPGCNTEIGGLCHQAMGVEGARIAIFGAPANLLRDRMKTAIEKLLLEAQTDPVVRDSLPVLSRAGGPYALDNRNNYNSYMITGEAIQEKDVPRWVKHLKQYGIQQIYFHQGTPYRQGDFEFDKKAYPNGISDVRKMTDAFRRHGIYCGLHTYSMFIPFQHCRYVTPIPSQELAAVRTLKLATDLSAETTEIPVAGDTKGITAQTAYLLWNSRYLQIGDELIRFTGFDPKGTYLKCERGALKTRKTAHQKGAKVRHLGGIFNAFFAPNPGGELFFQIARNIARVYDEGGFSIIYFDALDGNSRVVADRELLPYYDSLFVREVLKNIRTEAPLVEYATMHPGLWGARSRSGAWDASYKGHCAFFDRHLKATHGSSSQQLLCGQMGWLALTPPNLKPDVADNYQIQTIFKEQIEYLGSKLLGYDYGFSLFDSPLENRIAGNIENASYLRPFLQLKDSASLTEKVKSELRSSGHFFTFGTGKNGEHELCRLAVHSVRLDRNRDSITINNPYEDQLPCLRIENLYSAVPYDSRQAIELLPFQENDSVQAVQSKTFQPTLDLSKHLALGIWVYGNGKGQILNVRVKGPKAYSGFNDHYYRVDHQGWKYVQWAEAENGEYPDFRWDPSNTYKPWEYSYEYRSSVTYDKIEEVQLFIHGDPAGLHFRSLKALPLIKTNLTDPILQLDGRTVRLKGSIPSGCYVEFDHSEEKELKVKNPKSETIGTMSIVGDLPLFIRGENSVRIRYRTELKSPSVPRSKWTWKLKEKVQL